VALNFLIMWPNAADRRQAAHARLGAIVFDHVDEAAQPFVVGSWRRRPNSPRSPRTWIVAANLRAQERIHNELSNWLDP